MNPTFCKYILQRRQGQFWGSHFLILALNCNKVFVSFISRGVTPKFLDLSNTNFQGLSELISLLVQQNLGCFVIHTYIVYLVESIS